MIKKPGSGRPGGNPDISKHGFQAAGDEPNIYRLNVRIPESLKIRLDPMGKDKNQFVRNAIAKALEELDKSGEDPTAN